MDVLSSVSRTNYFVSAALTILGAGVTLILAAGFRKPQRAQKATNHLFGLLLIATAALLTLGETSLVAGFYPELDVRPGLVAAGVLFFATQVLYILYVLAALGTVRRKDLPRSYAMPVLIAAVVSTVIYILSLYYRPFRIPTDTEAYGRPFFWLGCLVEAVLLVVTVWQLVRQRKRLYAREKGALLALPVMMLLTAFAEPWTLTPAIRFSAMTLGLLIAATQAHPQLEREGKNTMMIDAQSRLRLAAGRMRPHYIYNVLTSIYYLCEDDPSQAQESIGAFSEYLRNSLETIEDAGLIPFSKELNQIRSYLQLEHMRFEERLQVKYDIDIENFLIPPLTVQPLVENAVKHGIAGLDRPGTVRIATRRMPDGGAQIRVIDDGVGFDTSKALDPGVTNTELQDLQERLRQEIDAELEITSAPGEGTMAVITLRSA